MMPHQRRPNPIDVDSPSWIENLAAGVQALFDEFAYTSDWELGANNHCLGIILFDQRRQLVNSPKELAVD